MQCVTAVVNLNYIFICGSNSSGMIGKRRQQKHDKMSQRPGLSGLRWHIPVLRGWTMRLWEQLRSLNRAVHGWILAHSRALQLRCGFRLREQRTPSLWSRNLQLLVIFECRTPQLGGDNKDRKVPASTITELILTNPWYNIQNYRLVEPCQTSHKVKNLISVLLPQTQSLESHFRYLIKWANLFSPFKYKCVRLKQPNPEMTLVEGKGNQTKIESIQAN